MLVVKKAMTDAEYKTFCSDHLIKCTSHNGTTHFLFMGVPITVESYKHHIDSKQYHFYLGNKHKPLQVMLKLIL